MGRLEIFCGYIPKPPSSAAAEYFFITSVTTTTWKTKNLYNAICSLVNSEVRWLYETHYLLNLLNFLKISIAAV